MKLYYYHFKNNPYYPDIPHQWVIDMGYGYSPTGTGKNQFTAFIRLIRDFLLHC